jgi:hypothetical protein
VRAVLQGLREPAPPPGDQLTTTVAGEVAATICLLSSLDQAAAYLAGLAGRLEAMPPEEATRPPSS